ncbi:MAG: VanW family protein [Patescibacteria group bacterium]
MIKAKELLKSRPEHTLLIAKIVILLLAILFFILALLFLGNAIINSRYQNVFLPGVKLGSVDIGNLTYDQAQKKVQERVDQLNQRGFVYRVGEDKVTVLPLVSSAESADISYSIVTWHIENSLAAIKNWQVNNNLTNMASKVLAWQLGRDWPVAFTLDQEQYLKILQENVGSFLPAKQEASFHFDEQGLVITAEKSGQTIIYQEALKKTLPQIKYLGGPEIELSIIEDKPQITTRIIEQHRQSIENIASRGEFILTFEDQSWSVASQDWRQWLQVGLVNEKPRLVFDPMAVEKYLAVKGIKEKVEIPMQDARFKLVNGKMAEFMASNAGRGIDFTQTTELMNQAVKDNGALKAALVTVIIEPKVMNSDVNDLGISSIIGTGVSDFKGSPVNRIHNIGVGAKTLDGMLISPGEEFSLVTALGEIDGEHGYRQELVIKGNKTTPEYGGGLCQIGTTVFRAALGTGLPITERRNHSYRVVYYEPAGMDATIYSPKPDLRFINDTGHYILIQSRIEGTKLYFDFWGTPDGRVASTTKPIIYNQVAPPPKKVIKTTELPVGQTKCTESAHAGADTKFDYLVQYSGATEPVKVTFSSHYVPWQSVCLLGATQEEIDAEQSGGTTATSTSTTTPQ